MALRLPLNNATRLLTSNYTEQLIPHVKGIKAYENEGGGWILAQEKTEGKGLQDASIIAEFGVSCRIVRPVDTQTVRTMPAYTGYYYKWQEDMTVTFAHKDADKYENSTLYRTYEKLGGKARVAQVTQELIKRGYLPLYATPLQLETETPNKQGGYRPQSVFDFDWKGYTMEEMYYWWEYIFKGNTTLYNKIKHTDWKERSPEEVKAAVLALPGVEPWHLHAWRVSMAASVINRV